jgi:hypothetical protein
MSKTNVDPKKLLTGYLFENMHLYFESPPPPQPININNINSNNNNHQNNGSFLSSQRSTTTNNNNNGEFKHPTSENNINGITDLAKATNLIAESDRTIQQELYGGNNVSFFVTSSSSSTTADRLGSSGFLGPGERCLVLFQRRYSTLAFRVPKGQMLIMQPERYFPPTPVEWKEALPAAPVCLAPIETNMSSGAGSSRDTTTTVADSLVTHDKRSFFMRNTARENNNTNNSFYQVPVQRLGGLSALCFALQENSSSLLMDRPSNYASVVTDVAPMSSFILFENKHLVNLLGNVNNNSNNSVSSSAASASVSPLSTQIQVQPTAPSNTTATVLVITDQSLASLSIPQLQALKPKTFGEQMKIKKVLEEKLRIANEKKKAEQEEALQRRLKEIEDANDNSLVLTNDAVNLLLPFYPQQWVAKHLFHWRKRAQNTSNNNNNNMMFDNNNNNAAAMLAIAKRDAAPTFPVNNYAYFSSNSNNSNYNLRLANNSNGDSSSGTDKKIRLLLSGGNGHQQQNNNEDAAESLRKLKDLRNGIKEVDVTLLDPIEED